MDLEVDYWKLSIREKDWNQWIKDTVGGMFNNGIIELKADGEPGNKAFIFFGFLYCETCWLEQGVYVHDCPKQGHISMSSDVGYI